MPRGTVLLSLLTLAAYLVLRAGTLPGSQDPRDSTRTRPTTPALQLTGTGPGSLVLRLRGGALDNRSWRGRDRQSSTGRSGGHGGGAGGGEYGNILAEGEAMRAIQRARNRKRRDRARDVDDDEWDSDWDGYETQSGRSVNERGALERGAEPCVSGIGGWAAVLDPGADLEGNLDTGTDLPPAEERRQSGAGQDRRGKPHGGGESAQGAGGLRGRQRGTGWAQGQPFGAPFRREESPGGRGRGVVKRGPGTLGGDAGAERLSRGEEDEEDEGLQGRGEDGEDDGEDGAATFSPSFRRKVPAERTDSAPPRPAPPRPAPPRRAWSPQRACDGGLRRGRRSRPRGC
jgi:hypothetical protein